MSKPPFSKKRKGKTVDPYPLGSKEKGKSSRTKKNRGRPKKPKVEVPEKFTYLLTWDNFEGVIVWREGPRYKTTGKVKGRSYVNVGRPQHILNRGDGKPPTNRLVIHSSTKWSKSKAKKLGQKLEKLILEQRVQDVQARLELAETYLATGRVRGVEKTEGHFEVWEKPPRKKASRSKVKKKSKQERAKHNVIELMEDQAIVLSKEGQKADAKELRATVRKLKKNRPLSVHEQDRIRDRLVSLEGWSDTGEVRGQMNDMIEYVYSQELEFDKGRAIARQVEKESKQRRKKPLVGPKPGQYSFGGVDYILRKTKKGWKALIGKKSILDRSGETLYIETEKGLKRFIRRRQRGESTSKIQRAKSEKRPTYRLGGPSITLPPLESPSRLINVANPSKAQRKALKYNPRNSFWDPNPDRKGNPKKGRFMKINFGFTSRIPRKKMEEYALGPYRKRIRRAAKKSGYTVDSIEVSRDGKRSRVEVQVSKIIM